jgi:hypothetical protein
VSRDQRLTVTHPRREPCAGIPLARILSGVWSVMAVPTDFALSFVDHNPEPT